MVRTICVPESKQLVFPVPQEYVGRKVEVLIFPYEETFAVASANRTEAQFNAVSIDTVGFKFDRDEANAR
ncbi:MAG: hypothetical protein LBR50_06215 [Tannerella sp.]|jgi:hypothetical protein|nr:hypothetical protein [Tannerella sp.]